MDPILSEDLGHIHRLFQAKERLDGATILITGSAGFLGFELLHYLARYGETLNLRSVIALDNFLLARPAWIDALPPIIQRYAFDIAADDIAGIPGAADASHVIHMASIASPTYYRKHPLETIDANVWGLRRLLDFYRDRPLKGLLFFSSSEVYGDPIPSAIPTDENYGGNVKTIGPRACYDESKRFGETLCYYYHTQYAVPTVIVRPFNNYGPGMRLADKRLPADFALAVLEDRPMVIHSDGTPTRTFCYISDAVAGYLDALTCGRFDTFNIGMDHPEISVSALAEIFKAAGNRLRGYTRRPILSPPTEAAYLSDCPRRRCPNIAKARDLLGYAPDVGVADGVFRFLSFLHANREGF